MDDITIIDDVLPKNIFEKIAGASVNNPNYAFNVIETSLPTDDVKSFAAVAESPWEKMFFSLPLWMCSDRLGIEVNEIFRIRFGLLHRDQKQIVNTPHVDNPYNFHYVGLFYLNNTDGSTKIWKQQHNNWGAAAKSLTLSECELMKEVEPKENRMVIFDGSHYHSSTLPSQTQLRYTINYNFL